MDEINHYDQLLSKMYDFSPVMSLKPDDPAYEFYAQAAQKYGDPVLDIGAATGIYTLPTARVGLKVTSFDLSEHMLNVIRTKLVDEPPEVQARVSLMQGNMLDMNFEEEFNTVFLPGNAFLVNLTTKNQIKTLKNIYRALKPDGRLIMDVFTPDLHLMSVRSAYQSGEFTITPSGEHILYHQYVEVEPLRQIVRLRVIHECIEQNGMLTNRHTATLAFKYLYPSELLLLLQHLNFGVESYYSDFVSYRTKSVYEGHQIIVAVKGSVGFST